MAEADKTFSLETSEAIRIAAGLFGYIYANYSKRNRPSALEGEPENKPAGLSIEPGPRSLHESIDHQIETKNVKLNRIITSGPVASLCVVVKTGYEDGEETGITYTPGFVDYQPNARARRPYHMGEYFVGVQQAGSQEMAKVSQPDEVDRLVGAAMRYAIREMSSQVLEYDPSAMEVFAKILNPPEKEPAGKEKPAPEEVPQDQV